MSGVNTPLGGCERSLRPHPHQQHVDSNKWNDSFDKSNVAWTLLPFFWQQRRTNLRHFGQCSSCRCFDVLCPIQTRPDCDSNSSSQAVASDKRFLATRRPSNSDITRRSIARRLRAKPTDKSAPVFGPARCQTVAAEKRAAVPGDHAVVGHLEAGRQAGTVLSRPASPIRRRRDGLGKHNVQHAATERGSMQWLA